MTPTKNFSFGCAFIVNNKVLISFKQREDSTQEKTLLLSAELDLFELTGRHHDQNNSVLLDV